jgi:hypothetical protein
VTLVNRHPDEPQTAELLLRDYNFAGPATITTVTEGGAAEPRVLPDVATAHLEHGTETPSGLTTVLNLPARSFTVVEAPIQK